MAKIFGKDFGLDPAAGSAAKGFADSMDQASKAAEKIALESKKGLKLKIAEFDKTTELLKMAKENNENFININENSQSMQLRKLLKDVNPLFSQYYDEYKWVHGPTLDEEVRANLTTVRIYCSDNVFLLLRLVNES